MRLSTTAFILLLLAACSNNSSETDASGPTTPPATGPTPAEFAALGDEYSEVRNATLITQSFSLPTGPATYDGVMYVVNDGQFGSATDGLLGDLTVAVNFDSKSIDGTATGFYAGDMDSSGNVSGVGIPADGTVQFNLVWTNDSNIRAPISGNLEVDGDGIARDILPGSEVELFFMGNPTIGVRGGSDTVSYDGTSTQSNFIVYADEP